jgi:hypothetical protein
MDRSLISRVKQFELGETRIGFYWCPSCELLFALVNGDLAVTFADETRSGNWSVWKTDGPEADTTQAIEAVMNVGPLSAPEPREPAPNEYRYACPACGSPKPAYRLSRISPAGWIVVCSILLVGFCVAVFNPCLGVLVCCFSLVGTSLRTNYDQCPDCKEKMVES